MLYNSYMYNTITMYAQNVQIDKLLKPGVRVTVRLQESTKPSKLMGTD